MAYSVKLELWISAVILVCIAVFFCNLGKAEEDVPYETGVAGGDPAELVVKALLCFDDKNIYSSCEESYRLTASGDLHVPPNYADEYCEGPCLSETYLVLDCIENILSHYEFYNKATIQDIRDTIKAGCSYGPKRGNFKVAEHLQAEENSAHKVAYKILLELRLMIVVSVLLLAYL